MRPISRISSLLVLPVLALLFLYGCDNPKTGSLYDPSATYKPQPTIASVSPAGSAFAGMDTVIITGTNFSTAAAENSVFFNTTPATLLSATASQIRLAAPLVALDSVAIRVAVFGSDLFSNTFQYKLQAGVAPFGSLASFETATSLAVDASGNLYLGYSNNGPEAGILKFTPETTRSTYAAPTAGVAYWSGLKFGPSGYLYGARNLRAIYRFSPGGGGSATLWTQVIGTTFTDFDFDQSGNMWVGGNNTKIYKIDQNKVVSSYEFAGIVRSIRVFANYLYFSAKTTAGGEQIWRASITGGAMGTPEVYFDFAAVYPQNLATAITFSSDGILYIGSDSPDGVIVVNPDKSHSAPFAAYQATYSPGIFSLAWGASNDLYASSSTGVLMRFTVRGKTSAPYNGIQ